MTRDRFEEIVSEALDGIPETFQPYLENVAVFIEDEPTPEMLREMGLHPRRDTLFGVYHGVPLNRRSVVDPIRLPDRITIFYRPLVRACFTPARIRREVQKTIIHEIAHFFGLDEEEIRREGY